MRPRLVLVLVAVCLWSAGIAVRLAGLQVERHEEYRARARAQHHTVVELEPPRGTIYDARGRQLAVSVEVDSAYANPRRLQAEGDVGEAARRLAEVLGLDAAELAEDLSKDKEFVWVARQLDPPRAAAVAALEVPGVGFLEEYKRYYPMGEVAAQVLGFAGIDQRGLEGIEHLHDELVAGREGTQTLLRDARRGTAASPLLAGDAARPGASLHLTLDAAIQHIAERELAAAVERYGASGGSVVVLDPRTGAVLALASAPLIDANRFPSYPLETRRNRPVMDAYEPGSTFKMVTAAAALSANLLDPSDELDCGMGGITLAGVRIRDHKRFGLLTFRDVIARSSNVGAIKTGLILGDQRLYDAVRAFGFGAPTGVDLPAENPGELAGFESWQRWPLTKAYVAFGQGVSVTPLQLARAFAAVANGGELLRPWVLAAVEEPGVAVPEAPHRDRLLGGGVALAAAPEPAARRRPAGGPEVVGRPRAPATARELERMLEAVVEEGTGRAAAVAGYSVAGKTGTAQKAEDGGYSPRNFVASFVGFVPARDPRLVIVVAVDEPWPSYHGGAVAAPVFARIAEQALVYLGVPPDRPHGAPVDEPEGEPLEEPLVEPPLAPGGIALASTAALEGPPA